MANKKGSNTFSRGLLINSGHKIYATCTVLGKALLKEVAVGGGEVEEGGVVGAISFKTAAFRRCS